MFATGPRAVGFTIVCPEGVIFRSMMTYQAQFLLLAVAGWVNRQQQDVIDYLQEENRVLRAGLRGKRLRLSDDDRRRLAVKAQVLGREVLPRLRPLPHPLRLCAGTATSSQPSTMAVKTGAQADLRRRRTSVSSWYAWRGRTRRGDICACGVHSRTSDMNLDATPSAAQDDCKAHGPWPGRKHRH